MDNETTQAQDYGTYAAPVDTSVTSTEAQVPVDQEVQPVDTYDTDPSAVSDDALMDPYADPSASWESAPMITDPYLGTDTGEPAYTDPAVVESDDA